MTAPVQTFDAYLKQLYNQPFWAAMNDPQLQKAIRLQTEFERCCIPVSWPELLNSHDRHQFRSPERAVYGSVTRGFMRCDHCEIVLVEMRPGAWYVPGNEEGAQYCQRLKYAKSDALLDDILL